jgi:hypothetical protein
MIMSVQIGVLASIFSVRRLRKTLGNFFDGDCSRVSAHRQTSDEFKTGTESDTRNGIVHSKVAQLIPLPLKCSGLVVQQEIHYIPTSVKCSMVVKNHMNNSTTTKIHQQFILLITFRMKTVDRLKEERKAAHTTVQDWNIGDESYDSE